MNNTAQYSDFVFCIPLLSFSASCILHTFCLPHSVVQCLQTNPNLTPMQKLSPLGLSFGMGLTVALYMFCWTVLVMYMPEAGGMFLGSLEGFMGYSVSWPGAFLIAVYSFIDGAIFGALTALFYNLFSGAK